MTNSDTANLLIRPETPDDHADIAAVTRLAFGQDEEADLIARIRSACGFDPGLSLVARDGDQTVGHILFSGVHIESPTARVPALALAPMAVLPERQNRGIGSRLVRDGLVACRRAGHEIVLVVGHAGFYPRFGFKPCCEYGIRAPFEVPNEAFMVLGLHPTALGGLTGVVKYPSAFGVD